MTLVPKKKLSILAKTLRELRKRLRKNQDELGMDAGFSKPSIAHWECGTSAPSRKACLALAAYAKQKGHVDIGEIFSAKAAEASREYDRDEQLSPDQIMETASLDFFLTTSEKAAAGDAQSVRLLELSKLPPDEYDKTVRGVMALPDESSDDADFALYRAGDEKFKVEMLRRGRLLSTANPKKELWRKIKQLKGWLREEAKGEANNYHLVREILKGLTLERYRKVLNSMEDNINTVDDLLRWRGKVIDKLLRSLEKAK